MTTRIILPLLLTLGAMLASAQTTQLREGDPLPRLQLNDQHNKPAALPTPLRRIILAADNDGAGRVTALLDARPAAWLQQTQQVYLADIHRMPGLITRLFALPKLQEKPYSIILGREESDLAAWPRQKGCVTLLPVVDGKIGKIEFACNDAALNSALPQ